MRYFKKILIIPLVLNIYFQTSASAVPESFADLAEKLMPSVVNISTTQTVKTTNNQFPFNFLQALLLRNYLKITKDRLREKHHH